MSGNGKKMGIGVLPLAVAMFGSWPFHRHRLGDLKANIYFAINTKSFFAVLG
jgi:hypothetical protein